MVYFRPDSQVFLRIRGSGKYNKKVEVRQQPKNLCNFFKSQLGRVVKGIPNFRNLKIRLVVDGLKRMV